MTKQTYPKFLGYDGSGDCVWELENGRWTWGVSPRDATYRDRTFEPVRYIEKYGRPVGADEEIDRKAEGGEDPAELAKLYLTEPVTSHYEDGLKHGGMKALAAVKQAAQSWAEGVVENNESMGRRDRKPADEQEFRVADILRMIDDAAREIGVEPVYSEGSN